MEIFDTIGLTERQWEECVKEILAQPFTYRIAKEELGVSFRELLEVIKDERFERLSEKVAILWRKKDREEITVGEFIKTAFLLKFLMECPPEGLRGIAAMEAAIELLKLNGQKIPIIGTAECLKLQKRGEEEKCPTRLECAKAHLISALYEFASSYTPRSFEDFLQRHKWVKEKVELIIKAENLEELERISESLF
jgi:hypothetical protein